ncbi:MAG: DUF2779 domain-containing protein, partial [Hyphomicrobium sp.]
LNLDGKGIFQATFVAGEFLAKCDVLVPSLSPGKWDLFEVKGTNSRKDGENEDRDHISDLAFQTAVLERCGISLNRLGIVHLDKAYVRDGELDTTALFVVDTVTDLVRERLPKIEAQMAEAAAFLNRADEPADGCACHYHGRSRQCTTFSYSHPEIPAYSVHDIVRIGQSKKKLKLLVDDRVYALNDVPDDIELSEPQRNQVMVHQRQTPIVVPASIKAELETYTFPLYFFDYETYAPAIPAFDGYSPYQRIPFQFSLHVVRSAEAAPEHIDYLHEAATDPTDFVGELLAQHIDPRGTVLVWSLPFERGVNSEIGKRRTQHATAMTRINGQLKDLQDIFKNQWYVDHGFKGKTSIKNVLPVLCPELSYKSLEIQEGATASNKWWEMVAPTTSPADKQRIDEALRQYCGLDTYAMYA